MIIELYDGENVDVYRINRRYGKRKDRLEIRVYNHFDEKYEEQDIKNKLAVSILEKAVNILSNLELSQK